jgi:hypothetical protein
MPNRLALSLVLLPALILAPACDDKQGPDSGDDFGATTDSADSDGTDGASTTDADLEPVATSETDATATGMDEPGDETDGETAGTGDLPEPPPQDPPPSEPRPDEAIPCADVNFWGVDCTTEGGEAGTTFCIEDGGEQVWTECQAEVVCYPGDNMDYGCMGQICGWDGEKLVAYGWSEPDCNTPLVLNFDGAPLRFDAATAASFDISGVGECLSTDWPALPWLALDRDGDGSIDSGRELFGSGTVLRSGARADHGFMALSELDINHDGRIDAADPAFAELVLWSDGDGDRRGELSELVPVATASLVAIHLDVDVRVECDARGNCGRERSRFEFRAPTGEVRTGEVVDVYLACQ